MHERAAGGGAVPPRGRGGDAVDASRFSGGSPTRPSDAAAARAAADGERFQKWEPVAGLAAASSRLVELRDDADGLALTIAFDAPPPRRLAVAFAAPLAHRRSSCEVFIHIWSMEVPHPSYTVENARWSRWLHEESFGQFASASLAHCVITTARDFIEVLAAEAPTVRWLER